MTRSELPREDLLRDAVAYSERVLLRLSSPQTMLFAGFRKSGAASLYFDEDPVLQFNGTGELRRVYWKGAKYVAKDRRLFLFVFATREDRRSARIQPSMQPLDVAEEGRILQEIETYLSQVAHDLLRGEFAIEGAFPPHRSSALVDRLCEFVRENLLPLRVAMVSAANG